MPLRLPHIAIELPLSSSATNHEGSSVVNSPPGFALPSESILTIRTVLASAVCIASTVPSPLNTRPRTRVGILATSFSFCAPRSRSRLGSDNSHGPGVGGLYREHCAVAAEYQTANTGGYSGHFLFLLCPAIQPDGAIGFPERKGRAIASQGKGGRLGIRFLPTRPAEDLYARVPFQHSHGQVGREPRDGRDFPRALEIALLRARSDVPYSHRLVLPGTEQRLARRVEGNRAYRPEMPHQGRNLAASLQVPEPHHSFRTPA